MNFWTILWMVIGCTGLSFGVVDASPLVILMSCIQIVGAVGMWVGFPAIRWLLIAFFCLGFVGRLRTGLYGHFTTTLVISTLLYGFLAVRFIRWRSASTPRSSSAD